ncbi:uncharacterized protein MELLADRAFT_111251 [Melampsora larici-populina 98AG31]|uniref:Uncharacterized protein n=1 Tax=Melampsora larici-populina (strain 98AG31 / pathotype 3-4-7) TaxID=747676 RepID=F4S2K0_MELLP|nr:uncharacterized protein MELLADRAFT_111251 [Melampsora larici-populina 98AG31]EGG01196.1 hypothetical protein MELLADRAFT_111251 [Melampsora larici-populina 98AG31]
MKNITQSPHFETLTPEFLADLLEEHGYTLYLHIKLIPYLTNKNSNTTILHLYAPLFVRSSTLPTSFIRKSFKPSFPSLYQLKTPLKLFKMGPQVTPGGKNGLPRRPRSSSAKKAKPYDSPSLSKRQTTEPPTNLTDLNSSMTIDQPAQSTATANQEDEEMNLADPVQSQPAISSSNSNEERKKKRTKANSPSSEESESSEDSSSDSDDNDDNDVESKPLFDLSDEKEPTDPDKDLLKDIFTQEDSNKTDEVKDRKEEQEVQVPNWTPANDLNNSGTNRLPYPSPGSLTLHTVNPLKYSYQNEFAFTCDLPYELQLWWQLYHRRHVSPDDINLWAIVTIISQKFKSNLFEEVKRTLNHCINHIELIVNVSGSRFFLIRFKNLKAKDGLQRDPRHDKGVFVSYQSGFKKPTTLLIFELDPITKLTPKMSSLLVTIHGLPFPLCTQLIADTVFGAIAAHESNFHLELEGIRELRKYPVIAHGGGRVFEVLFKRDAVLEWFKLLSKSNKSIKLIGWNHKGKETDDLYLIQIRHVPTCPTCGTTSVNASHSTGCPFATLRDGIIKSLKRTSTPSKRSKLDQDEDSEDSTPLASSSNKKPRSKIGNFTIRN